MKKSFLPTSKLFEEESYSQILGFPKITKRQLQLRLKELEDIGIAKIAFWGPMKIGTTDILGKGYVGIVLLCRFKNKTAAVKIRRTDSQRSELKTESALLQKANQLGVGPKFYDVSKNLLVMEYLDGQKIGHWIKDVKGKGSVTKVKSVLRKILEDCYRLDVAGIDHGELSNITKHVIVGEKKCTIIDFESSSTKRRVSNVTSAAQGLFIGSGIAKKVSQIYKAPEKQKIIEKLRLYKQDITDENFKELLKILKL